MTLTNTMQTDDESTANSESPGRRLRTLRQARGLDIERIAAQLHLDRAVVEAIEQDRYDILPTQVFVTGYLRNYARLLATDPAPIIGAYRDLAPAQDGPVVRVAIGPTRRPSRSGGNPWGWLIGLLLMAVPVLLLALWWQGGHDSMSLSTLMGPSETPTAQGDSTSSQTAQGANTEAPSEPSPAPIDSFGSAVSVPSETIPLRSPDGIARPVTPETTPPGTSSVAEETPAAPSEPEPAPAATDPTQPKEIALEFKGTTWVDVRDAEGKIALNGEMRAGDHRVLTGKPPFKLVIGNTAATQITVGGQAFDLQSRSQGNVARFSLNPNPAE